MQLSIVAGDRRILEREKRPRRHGESQQQRHGGGGGGDGGGRRRTARFELDSREGRCCQAIHREPLQISHETHQRAQGKVPPIRLQHTHVSVCVCIGIVSRKVCVYKRHRLFTKCTFIVCPNPSIFSSASRLHVPLFSIVHFAF